MATLSLTTADNYTTLVINGTTIKKVYAQKRKTDGTLETAVQIYQKWKDSTSTVTKYANTADFKVRVYAYNTKTWYSGYGQRSYCRYWVRLQIDRSWIGGNSYFDTQTAAAYCTCYVTVGGTTTISSKTATRDNSSQPVATNVVNTDGTYTTRYRSSDSSYQSRSYSVYVYRTQRNSSGTDALTTYNGTTPSNTNKSSSTTTNTVVNDVTIYGYNKYTQTTTTRVKDE